MLECPLFKKQPANIDEESSLQQVCVLMLHTGPLAAAIGGMVVLIHSSDLHFDVTPKN